MSLKSYFESNDRSWTHVTLAIWSQVVMNLILTACVPSLKGVFDIFGSGTALFTLPCNTKPPWLVAQDLWSRIRTALNKSGNESRQDNNKTSRHSKYPIFRPRNGDGQHSAEVSSTGRKLTNLHPVTGQSESQTNLARNAILRTDDYEVEVEDQKHSQSSVDYGKQSVH